MKNLQQNLTKEGINISVGTTLPPVAKGSQYRIACTFKKKQDNVVTLVY